MLITVTTKLADRRSVVVRWWCDGDDHLWRKEDICWNLSLNWRADKGGVILALVLERSLGDTIPDNTVLIDGVELTVTKSEPSPAPLTVWIRSGKTLHIITINTRHRHHHHKNHLNYHCQYLSQWSPSPFSISPSYCDHHPITVYSLFWYDGETGGGLSENIGCRRIARQSSAQRKRWYWWHSSFLGCCTATWFSTGVWQVCYCWWGCRRLT